MTLYLTLLDDDTTRLAAWGCTFDAPAFAAIPRAEFARIHDSAVPEPVAEDLVRAVLLFLHALMAKGDR